MLNLTTAPYKFELLVSSAMAFFKNFVSIERGHYHEEDQSEHRGIHQPVRSSGYLRQERRHQGCADHRERAQGWQIY